jgi:hypothetical protein
MRFWADQQEGVMLAVAKFQTDIRVRHPSLPYYHTLAVYQTSSVYGT